MKYTFVILLLFVFATSSFAQHQGNNTKNKNAQVTFIELGSTRCIPCQKMQKVILQVQKKYPSRVQTVFYDVWTKEQKAYGDIYAIDMIPTQVFLDKDGKEYYRHEGYFPFDSLEQVLRLKIK